MPVRRQWLCVAVAADCCRWVVHVVLIPLVCLRRESAASNDTAHDYCYRSHGTCTCGRGQLPSCSEVKLARSVRLLCGTAQCSRRSVRTVWNCREAAWRVFACACVFVCVPLCVRVCVCVCVCGARIPLRRSPYMSRMNLISVCVCVCVCLSVYLSVCVRVCVCVSVCLSVCAPVFSCLHARRACDFRHVWETREELYLLYFAVNSDLILHV